MFANLNYAKVWKIYPPDKSDQKYTKVQLSTSRRVGEGKYETDFSGYAKMVGKAYDKSLELEAQDGIKILKCGVTTSYNKEQKKNYESFLIFDFEFTNKNKESETGSNNSDDFMELPEDAKLPFED